MNIRNYNLSIYDPLENNILIDKYQLYWEPSYNNYGLNQFYIEASDGMASDTSLLSGRSPSISIFNIVSFCSIRFTIF